MTTKIINDVGFMLLGIIIAFGLYTEQFHNQWVLMVSTNALVAFVFMHYKPQFKLFNWNTSQAEKMDEEPQQTSAKQDYEKMMANMFDLPPVPNLNQEPQEDAKIIDIRQKYNINNNVDYNQDDENDNLSNVIQLNTFNRTQKNELTQQGVDQFIQESKKVVSLADYRKKKTGSSGFDPIQGA